MPQQNPGNRRQLNPPLTRRLGLRLRCARPEQTSGQGPGTHNCENNFSNGLMRWQSRPVLANPRCR